MNEAAISAFMTAGRGLDGRNLENREGSDFVNVFID
jgi:hypothetical protein